MKKSVDDLGIAAFILMHGFHISGRKSRTFYFEVENEQDLIEIDKLSFEYLSGPHRQFDTCLMSLKKIGEYLPTDNKEYKIVTDLGLAAFILMHGFKVKGRKGRTIYFYVSDQDINEFEKLSFEYLSSTYHDFDSCLMILKKVGEYTPNDVAYMPLKLLFQ